MITIQETRLSIEDELAAVAVIYRTRAMMQPNHEDREAQEALAICASALSIILRRLTMLENQLQSAAHTAALIPTPLREWVPNPNPKPFLPYAVPPNNQMQQPKNWPPPGTVFVESGTGVSPGGAIGDPP